MIDELFCIVWVNLDDRTQQGQSSPTDLGTAKALVEERNQKYPRILHAVSAYPPSPKR